MSKVVDNKEKNALTNAGFRLDRIIHRRRRERDLIIKKIKYVRNR